MYVPVLGVLGVLEAGLEKACLKPQSDASAEFTTAARDRPETRCISDFRQRADLEVAAVGGETRSADVRAAHF